MTKRYASTERKVYKKTPKFNAKGQKSSNPWKTITATKGYKEGK